MHLVSIHEALSLYVLLMKLKKSTDLLLMVFKREIKQHSAAV